MYSVLHFQRSKASNMRQKAILKQKGPLSIFLTLLDFPPFFGTVRLFKFLIFSEIFFIAPKGLLIKVLIFCNKIDVQKIPKGPPFTFFGTKDLPQTSKNFRKSLGFFLKFLVF